MGLLQNLGHKRSGDLILANDWNAVIAALSSLEQDFEGYKEDTTQAIQRLNGSLNSVAQSLSDEINTAKENLQERIESAEQTIQSVEQNMRMLLSQVYKVKLHTPQSSYAIGQQAEIVAQVTDFFDQPITTRPWIDFVTTWGRFKAAGGTSAQLGEGGRSISVRADNNGEVRVLLRADHVDASLDQQESSVQLLLQAFASPLPIQDVILSAATPHDAAQAFVAIGERYQDSLEVREYLDRFYYEVPKPPADWVMDHWRDYHTTILAVVKDDSDPRTPDTGRAYGAIQVTYRDWIIPWTHNWSNPDNFPDLVAGYAEQWQHFFDDRGPVEKFDDVLYGDMLGHVFKEMVPKDLGIVGRERVLGLVEKGLDPLINPGDPAQAKVMEAVQGLLRTESKFQGGFGVTTPEPEMSLLETFANVAENGTLGLAQVHQDLGGLQQEFSSAKDTLQGVQTELTDVTQKANQQGIQLETYFSDAGQIGRMEQQIAALDQHVGQFMNFQPNTVMAAAGKLDQVQLDMDRLFQAMNLEPPSR